MTEVDIIGAQFAELCRKQKEIDELRAGCNAMIQWFTVNAPKQWAEYMQWEFYNREEKGDE